MLMFPYLSGITKNVSVTSKALVGDDGPSAMFNAYSKFTWFQLFTKSGFVNEIVAITQTIYYVDVQDA